MTIQLTKHHGLGNDFLITFTDAIPTNGAALAQSLCDRTTGIGADGLVFGVGSNPVEFVLFNADGSRAEVSGNGLRCFGQALAMREGVTELDVTVASSAGPRQITVIGPNAGSTTELDIEVDMGSASAGPSLDDWDPARHLPATTAVTVDMGNPHVVIAVPNPRSYDMAEIGPQIEADFMPVGINVHLVEQAADGSVVMNIWERGAGVTQACGSGACASGWAAHHWDWASDELVAMDMPGGRASVRVGSTIRLRGPATFIGAMSVPGELEGAEATHG